MCFYYTLQVVFNKRHGKNGCMWYIISSLYSHSSCWGLFRLWSVVALCRLAGWYEYSRRTCCLCLQGWRIRYKFVTVASLHGVPTHMTIFWTSRLSVESLSCEWVVARYKGSHYTFGKNIVILQNWKMKQAWELCFACFDNESTPSDPYMINVKWLTKLFFVLCEF